ncbi:MAG: RNA polymerase sigma-70 factor [Tannerellaceae bacterium]|nr:RNA polymerase sigma-70 factor [Tannerellaceae bacterium]
MKDGIDIQIVEALREGDHKAFEKIFVTCYNKTKTFIYGYIKSGPDAEELTEELFVTLWHNRMFIDTSKSFNSYLHTIARNAAIDFLRRKYVQDAYLTQQDVTPLSATSEEELIAKELCILIDQIVEAMPEQRRKIYQLSRNEGLSNTEIAEQLHTTKRNVESQLSLALKEIRKAITLFYTFSLKNRFSY